MIPYDIDPTLHDAAPQETLDDGFSAPPHHEDEGLKGAEPAVLEAALGEKSPF
jgi:hypothetical protein